MFRGGNGHHRDSMEIDGGSQRLDLPIGLIVIVLQQYNNYHIKFQILRRDCTAFGSQTGWSQLIVCWSGLRNRLSDQTAPIAVGDPVAASDLRPRS